MAAMATIIVIIVIVAIGPLRRGGAIAGLWRGRRRGRADLAFTSPSHEFFQLTTIKPDAAAGRAHIKFDALAVHRRHGRIAIGTQ